MAILISLGFQCMGSISLFAQETDSLKNEVLPDVVIQAKMQETSAKSSLFTPTVKQKSSAQNAIDLLQQIAIPQISINLKDNSVSTLTGGSVALFINYIPASKEDIEGLLTTDVRRVEYLDFPMDPRFHGSEHIVNFIVHTYEYGGYTKLSVNESFLAGLSSNISLYSKYAYKKMIYDIYVASENLNLQNVGTSTIGTYSLLDDNGSPIKVIRKEKFDKAHYKQNSLPITFRATYDTDKIQVINTFGFSYSNRPIAQTSGILSFEPTRGNDYSFTQDNPTTRKLLTWSGNYHFVLGSGLQWNITPYASYGNIADNSLYSTTLPNSIQIENNAKENQYRYGIGTSFFKNIAQRQRLFLRAYYGTNKNKVSYSGTSPYDNVFISRFTGATLGYNFSNNHWNLSTDLAFQWEENKINKQSIKEIYPLFNISAGYSPSSKHSFRTFFHYGANYPGADIKTPNVLMDNELMYKTGNPNLGLSQQITYNLSYNWMPNNRFSSSVYAQYYGEKNLYVPIYSHHDDGKALIRSYDTNAQYHRTQIGTSLSYKAFEGKLQLAASPSVTLFRVRGIYDLDKAPFYFNTSATYYLNSFYFRAAYQTKFQTIQGNRAVYYEDRDFYQLQVGWSKNNFNIRVNANNLLRNDWLTSTETFNSPLYSEVRYLEGNNFHRRINLSLTYTFGYGKKVQRGNEVGQQYGSNSAILK